MAVGVRFVQDSLDIMRTALGRKNENDPEATDEVLLRYLNDFVSLIMPNDSKLIESFGTLSFVIDPSHPDGVYTFNDVGASFDFINISAEAYISIRDPLGRSVSWNQLPIYQDPGEFYAIWGINNEEILIKGYPTMMLFYGNEFVFRTIPEREYLIKIYGYKKNFDYPTPDVPLDFDYWLRYVAYGGCVNYARDYRYAAESIARIEQTFKSEKKQMLTRTHNQIKMARAMPRF